MSIREDLELLEQIQQEAEQSAEEQEYLTGIPRREFVFMSVIAAAATTFGFGSRALAQGAGAGGAGRAGGAPAGRGGGGGQGQTPPPLPEMTDPISWTFQPYPGGTGALMEKLINERGAAAFKRSVFTVPRWSGAVPTSEEDLAFLPAHRLSALLKERKITSTQITKIYLDRIKRYDPVLLCAVTIMEEQALAAAAKADAEIAAGRYRGPLHGIPYGLKDLFAVKGTRTTWGDADFENRIIDVDSEVYVRLRDAGAVLIAKLATGRFASGATWYRGSTKNPWDIRRNASGSSTGPGSATAAGCVAFGIGTETSGSIVSPARENGLSALRPTFGRVSRHGGMVLAWSQDRVGPMCRNIEDCAMVFNTIHGVDEKDPGTITTPFQFDKNIKLSSLRIGADANAPAEVLAKLKELGAQFKPIAARPTGGGGGFGAESAAFFDYYMQQKARELGIDLNAVAARGRGAGAGATADSSGAGRAGAGAATGGAANAAAPADSGGRGRTGGGGGGGTGRGGSGLPNIPGGGGRTGLAFEFIQSQRRRHQLISRMHELLKDYDMYIPSASGDIGLHAQTGHPTAVFQYKFEPQPSGGGGGGGRRGGGAGAADTTGGAGRAAAPPPAPQAPFNPQPICAQICGNLYNDDLILSVAHQFQAHTDFHSRRPKIA